MACQSSGAENELFLKIWSLASGHAYAVCRFFLIYRGAIPSHFTAMAMIFT